MPLMDRQEIDLESIMKNGLISFTNIKSDEKDRERKKQTVHFNVDDYKFDEVWNDPPKYIKRLKQYNQTTSPAFSTYTNIPLAIQAFNVFRNRWCGCYWQKHDITVIPSVTWSSPFSYEFVFDGIRRGSVVSLTTLGSGGIYAFPFMDGFKAMCKAIKPEVVLYYAEPYRDMFKYADVLFVPYEHSSKEDVAEVSINTISKIIMISKGNSMPNDRLSELHKD
jgi:hypothetical protein